MIDALGGALAGQLIVFHEECGRHTARPGQLAQLADRRLQQLGVGREGDVLRLHRGVHRDPAQIAFLQGAGVKGQAQGLLQQNVQLAADALAPMAHAGALVRQFVPEELLAGEVFDLDRRSPMAERF